MFEEHKAIPIQVRRNRTQFQWMLVSHHLFCGHDEHSRIRPLAIGSTTAQMLRSSDISVLSFR